LCFARAASAKAAAAKTRRTRRQSWECMQ
jgi:hypothetical protein